MLNVVAVQLMNYLLRGPLIDPEQIGGSGIPQTERLPSSADLPLCSAQGVSTSGRFSQCLLRLAPTSCCGARRSDTGCVRSVQTPMLLATQAFT